MLFLSGGRRLKKGQLRTMLKSHSWDPKTWTPWGKSDSEEGESKVKATTDFLRSNVYRSGRGSRHSACRQVGAFLKAQDRRLGSSWMKLLKLGKTFKQAMTASHSLAHEAVGHDNGIINLSAVETDEPSNMATHSPRHKGFMA